MAIEKPPVTGWVILKPLLQRRAGKAQKATFVGMTRLEKSPPFKF
jgi:hypothetical protein